MWGSLAIKPMVLRTQKGFARKGTCGGGASYGLRRARKRVLRTSLCALSRDPGKKRWSYPH